MNKLTILITTLIFCQGAILNAQAVKRSFQDEVYKQTTVVIKDKAASDLDILNNQFDLNELGMDQQIKITTETRKAQPIKVEELVAVVEVNEVTEVSPIALVLKGNSDLIVNEEKAAKANTIAPSVKQATKRTSAVSSSKIKHRPSYNAKKGVKRTKKPAVKKQHKLKCYRF